MQLCLVGRIISVSVSLDYECYFLAVNLAMSGGAAWSSGSLSGGSCASLHCFDQWWDLVPELDAVHQQRLCFQISVTRNVYQGLPCAMGKIDVGKWASLAEPVHKSCRILGGISYIESVFALFGGEDTLSLFFSQLLIVLVSRSHATQLHAAIVVLTSRGSKTTTMRKPVETKPQLGLRRWVIVKSNLNRWWTSQHLTVVVIKLLRYRVNWQQPYGGW